MSTLGTSEAEWFEAISAKLRKTLLADGYPQSEAEELSFSIAQGIRDVPVLIELLERTVEPTTEEIMDAVYDILGNTPQLVEAAQRLRA